MNTFRGAVGSLKKTELVWRYITNLSPTLNYKAGGGDGLGRAEEDIVARLDRDGIAITSINGLLSESLGYSELDAAVSDLLQEKKVEIASLKLDAGNEGAIGSKTFNLEVLGSELVFDANDVFARFALSDTLLNIANAYFGMFAKLRYYNVWYTAASDSTARESQLWHFDREDNYILKVFLYLDDVDEGAGPFTYAPGTHNKGKDRSIQPEFFLEGGVRRSTDEQMNLVFQKENWIEAVGKKGTIIFADTRGFHKGGEARTKDRLMFTCMYTSPASESKQLIKFPPDIDTACLSKKQLRALGIKNNSPFPD